MSVSFTKYILTWYGIRILMLKIGKWKNLNLMDENINLVRENTKGLQIILDNTNEKADLYK